MYSLLWVSVAVAAAVVINTFIYFAADVDKNEDRLCDRQRCYVIGNRSKRVTRVAFGSCTRYNLGPQPMWQAIAGTDPDAFLWDGDFAYLDDPIVNCADPAYSNRCLAGCPGRARAHLSTTAKVILSKHCPFAPRMTPSIPAALPARVRPRGSRARGTGRRAPSPTSLMLPRGGRSSCRTR